MPLLNTITTPYAEAFLHVTEANGTTEQVIDESRQVLAIWNSSVDLRQAMASPVLEIEAKKKALLKLFGDQISVHFLNLLQLLADRQRIGYLDSVLERLLELYREQRCIALATIRSASPLSEAQQAALAERVKIIAGTDKVEINLELDASLIGGFVLSVGSQVIDASLSGQVRRLALSLAKSG